ncbi:MAG: sensory box histidine kinase/response regulator [Chitinophagaceae bacterium]|nr:sensory box histidine kinase/response regulator [Chitinophagaceae bacterium]
MTGISNTAWLSVVVDNLPYAVLLENGRQELIAVNNAFYRLFDLKAGSASHSGANTDELLQQCACIDWTSYSHRAQTLRKQKKAAQKEVIKLTDGRLLLRDYLPVWQEGVFTGHMWTFVDETERIKSEAALQEQRKFYEDVLNNIPSDIAVFSPEHKYLYINPVGVRDPALRKWLIGKSDYDYCLLRGKNLDMAEKRRKMFEQIAKTRKELEWEERIVNRQGEVEYHLRKMSPLFDDNNQLVWLIGYSVNITERKKIEEKIQLSEKRYRDLFNYSQAIICTHDLSGNMLTVNPSLLEVLGYPENEIIGRNLSDLLLPEDKQAFHDDYLLSIRTSNKTKGLFRILHKSGRKVYLLYQNYRVEESADTGAYIIAFAQDVTDRIKAEKELKEAKQVTEEIARNKERFLANMSHEIRTPMSGIIGITSFLQKSELTTEQRSYLNIIQESAHDLLTIINDILDLEKVGTGQVQLETIPFDIVAKTKSVIQLFDVLAKNKQTSINFENGVGESLCVAGDPTRYNQVMNNLLSNAVKFTHDGSVLVKASVTNETSQDVTLQFTVEDTGIGIDKDKLVKIFQPFTQAYPETTRKYGGTGLGLAITKNLLELQGGKIWVESRPRHGSAFHFSITYRKCSEAHKKLLEPKRRLVNTLGPLKVLVAEDNKVNQLLTKGMLETWQFRAAVANTGKEVLQLLAHENFDVILMDIQMPEMNGLEATRAIRGLPDQRKSKIPIIALTANALKGDEAVYSAAGMNGFLTKPFTESALYEAIERVLRGFESFEAAESSKPHPMAKQSSSQKLYDLTLVNELARGNQEFIMNLAKIFIQTVPPTSKEMVEACRQEKWEQVGKLAHKLKSTIDTMNIASLKDDIRVIEKNGKDRNNLEAVRELVAKTDSIITEVASQLQSEFSIEK